MKSRPLLVLTAFLVPLLLGCGPAVKEDLESVGLAYHSYHDHYRKGPPNWDAFIEFAKKESLHPESLKRIQDAGYTMQWEIEFQTLQATREQMTETVLAELPKPKRGPKLMMDGTVRYPK